MPLSHSLDEFSAWLRLSLEPGVGPVTARGLLATFGLPEQIYALPQGALSAHLSPSLAAQLTRAPDATFQTALERTLAWVQADDNHILTLADSDYPAALLDSHDPPVLLYVIGQPKLLSQAAIAIVGSRNATPDGLSNARAFARYLGRQGWCILSGLALGIDTAAHEGALEAGPQGGSTIAVIGTGADVVYPARNRALAHRIAAAGAIVSEFPLGTPAIAHQFPRRNRIVAGLAKGVLVAEAAAQSGSLITARLATEIGREVFAIPGSIHSPLSRGCHALIRQGAKLVETAQDILDELGATKVDIPRPQQQPQPAGPTDPVLVAMGYDPIHIDTLAVRCGLEMDALQTRLLELELAATVDRLPGGRYQFKTPSCGQSNRFVTK